jgi:spore coat protein CotH
MKPISIFLLLCFILLKESYSQTFTSSNLPIVIVTTDNNPSTGRPREIVDYVKVLGNMKVIERPNGARNFVNDQNNLDYLSYTGRIGIELRGSSSQDLPKKPYAITTLLSDNISNNNTSILGMPPENDWILNSHAFDSTTMRDFISYDAYGAMGNYSSRARYCELIVNGDFKGLYIFQEKLKIDDNRVNIRELSKTDNNFPDITGGYMTKCDKTTGGDPVAWTMQSYLGGTVNFIHDNPSPQLITTQQAAYIQNYFKAINVKNESILNGYPSLLDIPSFIDFMLINEISSNADAYQLSTFFHMDKNGKLRAGPVWDLNLTYGNDLFMWGFDRSFTNVWQFSNGNDNVGARFWKDLYDNETFRCYMSKRWKEMIAPGKPLNYNVIINKMDSLSSMLEESRAREQTRWNNIGNYNKHINAMKSWLQARYTWMNSKLIQTQVCTNINVPKLVISKINYHPLPFGADSSKDFEFIEITNNSNQIVNTTGYYFSELGISYVFPPNSKIGANDKIFIVGKENVFENFYRKEAFGEFARNLSNKSQRLVLSDAYGNIIDEVTYMDTFPWPADADGKGGFLELKDINSDNSLATNWRSSKTPLSLDDMSLENQNLVLYPNPTNSKIYVNGFNTNIEYFEVLDIMGRTVLSGNSTNDGIDLTSLSNNTYIIKLVDENGNILVKKIIKY